MKLKRKLLVMIMINTLLLKKFNNSTSDNFTAKLKKANLASKNDIADFLKTTDLIIN